MTEQPPSDLNSGIATKWGEFCDKRTGKSFVEEKWSEMHNPNDNDYWERKSEKVTSFHEEESIVDIVSQDSK